MPHDVGKSLESTPEGGAQQRAIRFLYRTVPGRVLLKGLCRPAVSRAAGAFLSTRLSKPLIGPFMRNNRIDPAQFEGVPFRTFNECFSRKIKDGLRPVDPDPAVLVAPADSRLTVLPITRTGRFELKGTSYTAASLLQDEALAARFEGGQALIFRLCVDDYHRYCFPAEGVASAPRRIPGVLHTVNPIANEVVPIYKQNARECTLLQTERFGVLALVEVGALLVGRIVNHPLTGAVRKGQEKGYFQYGGSTVIVLVQAGKLQVDDDLLAISARGEEARVRYGVRVGIACRADAASAR